MFKGVEMKRKKKGKATQVSKDSSFVEGMEQDSHRHKGTNTGPHAAWTRPSAGLPRTSIKEVESRICLEMVHKSHNRCAHGLFCTPFLSVHYHVIQSKNKKEKPHMQLEKKKRAYASQTAACHKEGSPGYQAIASPVLTRFLMVLALLPDTRIALSVMLS
eukprot:scaffold272717_cov19-Tisochrysis_lutea.AAC.1